MIWWQVSRAGRRLSKPHSLQLHNRAASTRFQDTTLLDPNEAQPFAGTGYITSIVHTKSKSVGVYFIDTAKLGRFFELSGGVRWDRFDTGYSLRQPAPSRRRDGHRARFLKSAGSMSSPAIARHLSTSLQPVAASTSITERVGIQMPNR